MHSGLSPLVAAAGTVRRPSFSRCIAVLQVGSILLLAMHFVAVDLTMAGPLVCIWLAWRESRYTDRLAGTLNVETARASLVALAIGIAVGCLELAIFWLADDRHFWRAVASVASGRLWFALAELIFFALCMAGYLWIFGRPVRRPWIATVLALLASLDLMAHFPPLFTMLNLLADRPSLFGQRLESALYRSLLADPEVVSMTAHVYLAAIAVTAVFVMARAARLGAASPLRSAAEAESELPATGLAAVPPPVVLGSARAALLATLLQLPVGIGVMLSVPNRLRDALLGDDLLATLPFACGVLATLGLLHTLAAVGLGDRDPRQVRRSLGLMLLTILFMTATLQRVRQLGRPTADRAGAEAAASQQRRLIGRAPVLRSLPKQAGRANRSLARPAMPVAFDFLTAYWAAAAGGGSLPGSLPSLIRSPKVGAFGSAASLLSLATVSSAASIFATSFLSAFVSSFCSAAP